MALNIVLLENGLETTILFISITSGTVCNPNRPSLSCLWFCCSLQAPPVSENVNLEVDASPAPLVSSSSDEAGVRSERFVPGLSQLPGFQAQKHQNQARAPRRGGRPKPCPGQGPPIAEHLERLALSDCTAQSQMILGDGGRQTRCRIGSGEEPEKQVPPTDLDSEGPKDGARGHRGRRRGPYRPALHHIGALGPPQQHRDSRARSRGGGGGPRRGHYGRGLQQKVVEWGREEVV